MFYLVAIGFYPIFLAISLPIGLALFEFSKGLGESRGSDDFALAPVVGLAAIVAAISFALHLGAPSATIIPVLLVVDILAIISLWRRQLDFKKIKLQLGLAGLGLIAYVLLILPLLTAGHFGVLGYGVNNDAVFHNIIPEYLNTYGYDFPKDLVGGFTEASADKLVVQGYPDGWHQFLLLAMRLFGLRAFFIFNFLEAFFSALLVPVAFVWLRKLKVSRMWAGMGGLFTAVGYLQLTYIFHGFAPQVAVTPFLYAVLFLIFRVMIEDQRRYLVLLALTLQAGLAVYSFTILLWVVLFLPVIAIYRVRATGSLACLKADIRSFAAALGLAAIINPFSVISMGRAFKMVTDWSAADSLGNLTSRIVPILPVFGIWPTGDHRGLPVGLWHIMAYAGGFLVLVVFLYGLSQKPGRALLISGTVAFVGPIILLKFKTSPYYFSKTLQLAAPMLVIGFVSGIYFLSRQGWWRFLALPLAIIYLFGAGFSARKAIIQTVATPDKRFSELFRINDRFLREPGRVLFVETGEDWGKYVLSDLKVASPLALSYRGDAPEVRPQLADRQVHDLDSLRGVLGRKYSLIIISKAQDKSLAPNPFELVFSGKYYNVFKKQPRAVVPLGHKPFEVGGDSKDLPYYELDPGKALNIVIDSTHRSLLVSAYLAPSPSRPSGEVKFSAGGRSINLLVKSKPAIYAVPLAGGPRENLKVINGTSGQLRLDWVAPLKQ